MKTLDVEPDHKKRLRKTIKFWTNQAKKTTVPKPTDDASFVEMRRHYQKIRDKRNGAINRDKLFRLALQYNDTYWLTGTIDCIKPDNKDKNVTVVCINTIHMTIDGVKCIANHTHIRSDRFDIDPTWRVGQQITIVAKIEHYKANSNKFEIVNA